MCTLCPDVATHERGGFPLCFRCFLIGLQWACRLRHEQDVAA